MRRHLVGFTVALVVTVGLTACGGDDLTQEEIDLYNEAAAERVSGKADTQGCSGVVVPDRSGFAKRIALTFDDGPNLTNTPKVLEVLAAHEAKATFFVNGKGVSSQAHKNLLVQMHEAGHLIGNHSQNHLNLKNVSDATLASEVKKTRDALEAIGISDPFFRFPFGSADCGSASYVRDVGYHITGWHIDSADWCYASGGGYCRPATFQYVDDDLRDDIVGFVLQQARQFNGGVLLMHDIHSFTANHLDAILTALEEDGFTFVRLDDTDTFPKLNGVTPALQPFVGKACQKDEDCGYTFDEQDGLCYLFTQSGDETVHGFCTLPCAGYCPDMEGYAPTFCTSLDGVVGMCVSKAGVLNEDCTKLAGTAPAEMDRFIGASSASAASAVVCVPH